MKEIIFLKERQTDSEKKKKPRNISPAFPKIRRLTHPHLDAGSEGFYDIRAKTKKES